MPSLIAQKKEDSRALIEENLKGLSMTYFFLLLQKKVMKHSLTFLSFLFVAAFISCESNPYQDSLIEMNKTACFGTCPVYSISISGDGNVVYEGKENAPYPGKQTTQLHPDATKELFDAFANADFFNFEDKYTGAISDLPTTFVSFTHNGQRKKVEDYYNAPKALKELENRLVAIVKDGNWQATE